MKLIATYFSRTAILSALSLSALLLLSACASSFNHLSGVSGAISRGESKAALTALNENDFPKRDWVVVRLERASLMQDAGQYKESLSEFEKAKDLMDEFYTIRLSESNYAGNPLEQLQVRNAQILAALAMGDNSSAAVMARQIDTILSEYDDRKEPPFACPPLSWYLASIALAANKEGGNAQVLGKKANACLSESDYSSQTKSLDIPTPSSTQGQVWVLVGEGFIGQKIERVGFINSSFGPVKFAWSDYLEVSRPQLDTIKITGANNARGDAIMAQDLGPTMRKLLEKNGALEKAAAIARTATVIAAASAAYQAAAKNEKVGAFFGTLAALGIVTAANQSVQAEVRSWRSLPRRWWIAHLTLPAGTHHLQLDMSGQSKVLKSKAIAITVKANQILTVFERFTDFLNPP